MAVDYTYIIARLNAIEASMPEEGWFDRLAGTEKGSLMGSLREYYSGFEKAESIDQFEMVLEEEKLEVLDLVSNLISDRDVLVFLRGGYDFDNLLYLWKLNHLISPNESMERETPVPFGLVSPEVLAEAIDSEEATNLPSYLKEIFGKLLGIKDDNQILTAQSLCESAKWNCRFDAAPSSYARFITKCGIDLENIKSLIRLKRTGLRKDLQDHTWIGGGRIDTFTMKRLFKEPEDELYTYLNTSHYSWLTGNGLDSETALWKIDPLISGQLLYIMNDSRYRYFDIGPVIYHLEIRERNETLLRSVITGKVNRLPGDLLSETVESIIV
ncbi:MAG: V-type ATPase subunit [Candidatus Krumholzibacteriota bacterium]|nr:V-type ATPase subunit [Candidatus Krumholzibacteriota bacterium]